MGNGEDEEDNEKAEDEKEKRKGYNLTGERGGEGERDGKWDLQRCPMGEEKEKKRIKTVVLEEVEPTLSVFQNFRALSRVFSLYFYRFCFNTQVLLGKTAMKNPIVIRI